MPKGENAAAFARTGATLVFFLSTGKIDDLMTDLMGGGGLPPDTPAAVVYRATWPDERILRGTVSDIARKVEEAGFGAHFRGPGAGCPRRRITALWR